MHQSEREQFAYRARSSPFRPATSVWPRPSRWRKTGDAEVTRAAGGAMLAIGVGIAVATISRRRTV